MSTTTESKGKVGPIAIGVAVLLLVLFVAWRAYAAFAGPPTMPLPPPPTAEINFLKQKAVECKGDYKKLSPEDQKTVDKYSHGWGPSSMASMYRQQTQPH